MAMRDTVNVSVELRFNNQYYKVKFLFEIDNDDKEMSIPTIKILYSICNQLVRLTFFHLLITFDET